VNDLSGDAGVLLTGTDIRALELVCDDIMVLADGVLVSG
jgi:hypothetical protein